MTKKRFKFKNVNKYVSLCKRLSNLPPNIATPDYFLEYIQSNLKNSLSILSWLNGVLTPLVYAVDPTGLMLMVEHRPSKAKYQLNKPIVLIGKGVTFDTGGYNIKANDEKLWEMKYDKCGAMAAYSVFKAIVDQDYPHPVILILPLVQNLIGPTLPGSIITSKKGIRVEIRDTDAEGRLILADAIEHAIDEDPGLILTIATLTGGCAYSLGDIYSGVFSNDDNLLFNLRRAGIKANDLVWPMPIHFKHLENLQSSKISDILNYNGKERGGSSGAAFLNYFVPKKIPWGHIDIAGTAWNEAGATGRPVKLLLEFFEELKRE